MAAERQAVADKLEQALDGLIQPDVVIDNPKVFYLHRVKDDQNLYFFVNPTFAAQSTQVILRGNVQPVRWEPSNGAEWPIVPTQEVDGNTHFRLVLPPAGSTFVLPMASSNLRIVEASITVDSITDGQVSGYAASSEGSIVLEHDGHPIHLVAEAGEPAGPLVLDGAWEFEAENDNALVLGNWLTTAEMAGTVQADYSAPDVDTTGWVPMVPGAWSYQLPAEPIQPYPINVWYRTSFQVEHVPAKLALIVDGFAGSAWQLFVNGQHVTAAPMRSTFDSQMLTLNIGDLVLEGTNVIAVRLTVTDATDGLLDLLKLVGDFSLAGQEREGYAIVAPRRTVQPASWTTQGYPFFSGRAVYRRR
ncbi:MAG: hypothetical protein GWN58_32110, partial [Anaerolineae bacterium]|nr:hypothetical protein [Anaerolineae bacterium]